MSGATLAALIAAASATAALISTVASIIYQGRQFRDQRRLLQRQAELFGLQAEGLRESTEQRRIDQASLVRLDTWASRLVPKASEGSPLLIKFFSHVSDEAAWISSARVCNESKRPIRDIQVRFTGAPRRLKVPSNAGAQLSLSNVAKEQGYARWVRLSDGTITLQAPLSGLGPARSAWFDSDYREANADSVELRFTDLDGRSWQTDMAGDLTEINTRDW